MTPANVLVLMSDEHNPKFLGEHAGKLVGRAAGSVGDDELHGPVRVTLGISAEAQNEQHASDDYAHRDPSSSQA